MSSNFLKDLAEESKECISDINNKIKNTGTAVYSSLMGPRSNFGTPVLTGHLKSNWIVTTDTEYSDVVGSPESVDESVRDAHWDEFVNTMNLYLKHNIFFSNNVYYGPYVNDGRPSKGIIAQRFKEAAIQMGDEYLKANKQ